LSEQRIELGLLGWALRPWRASDAAALQPLGNDERIARWMADTWPMPYTEADAAWWVNEGAISTGDTWAICLQDRPLGGCGVHWGQGFLRCNAEVGWWLSPDHWGQGIATQAARQMVVRALANPEITRVMAPIHAGNSRSMRVAEKAGMALEAVQPRSALKQGRVIDRHIYASYRT